ncbi:hypothetical protein P9112_012462 [Eukaryota sp. TZLM1-RC]
MVVILPPSAHGSKARVSREKQLRSLPRSRPTSPSSTRPVSPHLTSRLSSTMRSTSRSRPVSPSSTYSTPTLSSVHRNSSSSLHSHVQSKSSFGGWSKGDVGTVAPDKRYRHATAMCNNHLYIHGGNSGTSLLGDLATLDLNNLRWKSLVSTPAPSPREGHSLSTIGDQLVLIGGESSNECTIDVWLFDTVHERWTELTPSSLSPPPRCGHAVAIIGEKLIMFGGADRKSIVPTFYQDTWIFDLPTRSWTCIDSSGTTPSKRYGHSFNSINSRLFVFGGYGLTGRLNDTWEFDLSTSEWRYLNITGTLPYRRTEHASSVCNGSLLIHGGRGGTGLLSDLWMLDIGEGCLSWSQLQTSSLSSINQSRSRPHSHLASHFPRARHAHSLGFMCNEKGSFVYVFGGLAAEAKPLSDLWVLTLSKASDSDVFSPRSVVSSVPCTPRGEEPYSGRLEIEEQESPRIEVEDQVVEQVKSQLNMSEVKELVKEIAQSTCEKVTKPLLRHNFSIDEVVDRVKVIIEEFVENSVVPELNSRFEVLINESLSQLKNEILAELSFENKFISLKNEIMDEVGSLFKTQQESNNQIVQSHHVFDSTEQQVEEVEEKEAAAVENNKRKEEEPQEVDELQEDPDTERLNIHLSAESMEVRRPSVEISDEPLSPPLAMEPETPMNLCPVDESEEEKKVVESEEKEKAGEEEKVHHDSSDGHSLAAVGSVERSEIDENDLRPPSVLSGVSLDMLPDGAQNIVGEEDLTAKPHLLHLPDRCIAGLIGHLPEPFHANLSSLMHTHPLFGQRILKSPHIAHGAACLKYGIDLVNDALSPLGCTGVNSVNDPLSLLSSWSRSDVNWAEGKCSVKSLETSPNEPIGALAISSMGAGGLLYTGGGESGQVSVYCPSVSSEALLTASPALNNAGITSMNLLNCSDELTLPVVPSALNPELLISTHKTGEATFWTITDHDVDYDSVAVGSSYLSNLELQPVSTFALHHTDIQASSVREDFSGKDFLATTAKDRTIRVWDFGSLLSSPDSISPVTVFSATRSQFALSFAPSYTEPLLASGGGDKVIKVFSLQPNAGDAPLCKLSGHAGRVRVLSFIDSSLLVSGASDGCVALWDVRAGKAVAAFPDQHSGSIKSIAVRAGANEIVSGSSDGAVCAWDIRGNPAKCMHVLKFGDSVNALDVGVTTVYAGGDHSLKGFDFSVSG